MQPGASPPRPLAPVNDTRRRVLTRPTFGDSGTDIALSVDRLSRSKMNLNLILPASIAHAVASLMSRRRRHPTVNGTRKVHPREGLLNLLGHPLVARLHE
jgi:hypothetical protein